MMDSCLGWDPSKWKFLCRLEAINNLKRILRVGSARCVSQILNIMSQKQVQEDMREDTASTYSQNLEIKSRSILKHICELGSWDVREWRRGRKSQSKLRHFCEMTLRTHTSRFQTYNSQANLRRFCEKIVRAHTRRFLAIKSQSNLKKICEKALREEI